MQVGTLAVQHLFEKDVLYRVPLYQRPYVWTEAGQWQPLWDDLRRLAEETARGTAAPIGTDAAALADSKP